MNTEPRVKCAACNGHGGDGGQSDSGTWEWPCEVCGGRRTVPATALDSSFVFIVVDASRCIVSVHATRMSAEKAVEDFASSRGDLECEPSSIEEWQVRGEGRRITPAVDLMALEARIRGLTPYKIAFRNLVACIDGDGGQSQHGVGLVENADRAHTKVAELRARGGK